MRRFPRFLVGRLLANSEGASAVEFAIVFPLFFLLLFGIFEFARAMFAANTLQWGVAQAARYVTVHNKPTYSQCCPSGCSPTPSWDFSSITSFLGISGVSISPTVGTPSCSASQASIPVTVTGTYQFDFFLSSATATSLGLGSGIAMSQRAVVSIPLD